MIERTAKDVMTQEVLAVGADWTVEQLANFLIDNSISGAPVTSKDGDLVGVVSLTDIVRHHSLPIGDPRSHGPHDYYVQDLQRHFAVEEVDSYRVQAAGELALVRDIMTPMVFDVFEDTPVHEVAQTMVRGRIHRVFVTRERKVVGVITALDMLGQIAEAPRAE